MIACKGGGRKWQGEGDGMKKIGELVILSQFEHYVPALSLSYRYIRIIYSADKVEKYVLD